MLRLLVPLLLAACRVTIASDVLVLTADSFEHDLKHNKHVFLGVFAPWCGHCQTLKPAFEEAATRVRGDAVFASLDGSDKANAEIVQRLGVKGFPALKIFTDGKLVEDYQGERTAEALAHAARKHLDAGVEVLTKKQLKPFLKTCKKNNQYCGVGYALGKADAGSARSTFQALGEQLKATVHVGVIAVKVADKQRFVVHSPFDEAPAETADFALPEFGFWVQRTAQPKVLELGSPAYEQFIKRAMEWPSTRVMGIARSRAHVLATKTALLLLNHSNTTYMVTSCEASAAACNFFQVKAEDTPAVVVDRTTVDGKKYIKRNVDAETVRTFVDSALAGQEKPELRTSKVEDTGRELGSESEYVKPVTAETWDQHMGVALPYIVYVYSHTCPHCQDFTPTYKIAARSYTADNMDNTPYVTQFLAINGARNDIPTTQMRINGFPSVHGRFANGTYVPYDGFRVAEDLVAFARTLAVVPAAGVVDGSAVADAPESTLPLDAGSGLCAFDVDATDEDKPAGCRQAHEEL
jgi:protein disulfide isomerase